jgi:tRNA A37 threonylcarbamoyladenosine dehydratase
MAEERYLRSIPLFGEDGIERLKSARVAVFGVGGVGGHAAETLVRAGIENIDIFDADRVSVSNLNRQIIATENTVGLFKAEVMRDRILEINRNAKPRAFNIFYSPENSADFDLSEYDYIIDAIDTVTSKLELITRAYECGTKIISSMGTGNKLDPTMLELSTIEKTSVCPLARVMRTELRKRGIKGLRVVYSKEEPQKCVADTENARHAPASTSFVPPAAGLIIASEVVREIALNFI